jgi:Zn-dependent protease/CBS domain-containing protein
MPRQSISLGKILGIPIGLDYTWFLIFILITWSLATSYFPESFKNWPVPLYWVVGAATAILFFVSVLLHELGHSVVALRYKIPVRSITLFVFGGVAQIGTEPPSAVSEFWIAIAGPLTSFALAGVFGLLQLFSFGLSPLLALARYLAYINGTLALFNLIPGFPLDGGRVFRALVWGVTHDFRRATHVAATMGRGIAYVFILLGVWQLFRGNLANGLWIVFIGWFLDGAAAAQLQQQAVRDVLTGYKVSQVMGRNYTLVPSYLTIQQLTDNHILGAGTRFFLVQDGDRISGLLTIHNIKEVPRQDWLTTTVAQIMVPAEKMHRTAPDNDLWEALQEMDQDGVNQLPVMSEGQVMGVLNRENVIGFLRTLREFR